jgi:hypothetical protein
MIRELLVLGLVACETDPWVVRQELAAKSADDVGCAAAFVRVENVDEQQVEATGRRGRTVTKRETTWTAIARCRSPERQFSCVLHSPGGVECKDRGVRP